MCLLPGRKKGAFQNRTGDRSGPGLEEYGMLQKCRSGLASLLTEWLGPPYTENMSSTFAPRVGFDWRGFITPGVKLLVLICAGVFLLQTRVESFLPPYSTAWVIHWFGLVPLGPIPGLRLWQPVTYIFLHGGLGHLLINMLMLWMFGRELELVWGKKRFLNYFFICGVGAGIITILVKATPMLWGTHPGDVPTIGASGAIFGILIANAILFPDRRILLFPLPLTIPMRPFVAGMGGGGVFWPAWGGGARGGHLFHFLGVLVGGWYFLWWAGVF